MTRWGFPAGLRAIALAILGVSVAQGVEAFELERISVVQEVAASPSNASQLGTGIAVMSDGRRVVVGENRRIVDFDPTDGELIIDSPNETPFVAIYSDDNAPLLHLFENPNNFNASADYVVLDDADNIYVAGLFNKRLGVGDGLPDLVGEGADAYVAKLNAMGEVQWAFLIGGHLTVQEIDAIAVRGDRLIIAGITQSAPIDFDPDPIGEALAAGSNNGADSFIASYDLNGNFQWVNIITQLVRTGSGQTDEANGVVILDSGESFLAGAFNGTADFDGSVAELVVESDSADGFLAKFSSTGSPVWVKELQSPKDASGRAVIRRVGETSAGGIVVSGMFVDTIDFDPDASSEWVLTSVPANSAERFIAEYDQDGALLWARRIESGGSLTLGAVRAVAGERRLLAGGVGNFGGGFVDFNPEGPGGEHDVASGNDAFLVLFDATGNYEQSVVFSGASSINAGLQFRGIHIDGYDIHFAGDFNTTFDADPGPGEQVIDSTPGNSRDLMFGVYGFDQFFNSSFEPSN